MKSAFITILAIGISVVSAQTATCASQYSDCDTQLDSNHACCAALYAGCLAGTTAPDFPINECTTGLPVSSSSVSSSQTSTSAAASSTASSQAATCVSQYSDCDTQLDANHACCGALYASCIGGTTAPDGPIIQCTTGLPISSSSVSSSETSTSVAASSTVSSVAATNGTVSTTTTSTASASTTSALAFSGDAAERLDAGRILGAGLAAVFAAALIM